MLPFLLAALACGPSDKRYAEEMGDAVCALYEDCGWLESYGFDSAAACAEQVSGNYDPEAGRCPAYDRKAARQCLEELAELSCEAALAGDWPESCAESC